MLYYYEPNTQNITPTRSICLSLFANFVCLHSSVLYFLEHFNKEVIKLSAYLTVAQAADEIQVNEKTIRRRIADGQIKAIRLGQKTIRISVEELDRYMKEHTK